MVRGYDLHHHLPGFIFELKPATRTTTPFHKVMAIRVLAQRRLKDKTKGVLLLAIFSCASSGDRDQNFLQATKKSMEILQHVTYRRTATVAPAPD